MIANAVRPGEEEEEAAETKRNEKKERVRRKQSKKKEEQSADQVKDKNMADEKVDHDPCFFIFISTVTRGLDTDAFYEFSNVLINRYRESHTHTLSLFLSFFFSLSLSRSLSLSLSLFHTNKMCANLMQHSNLFKERQHVVASILDNL